MGAPGTTNAAANSKEKYKMTGQSKTSSVDELQKSVRDRIDKEVKKFTGSVRRNSPTSNRADTALGLSILAMATLQTDDTKAKKLLDLLGQYLNLLL